MATERTFPMFAGALVLFFLIPSDGYGYYPPDPQDTELTQEIQDPANLGAARAVPVKKIRLSSSAFGDGGMIPVKNTCDGANTSPSLRWTEVPSNTESIALLMEDPDAPGGNFVHWIIYNLPPGMKEIPENAPKEPILDNDAQQGTNSFVKIGYSGPCPPRGTHRYYYRIYALDQSLSLESGATEREFRDAIKGHILADGELMGRYERKSVSGSSGGARSGFKEF